MSAVVEYKGETYRYDEATGTNLGDYIDPRKRFVQGCIRVTHDLLPLTVFFRRDRGTNRARSGIRTRADLAEDPARQS